MVKGNPSGPFSVRVHGRWNLSGESPSGTRVIKQSFFTSRSTFMRSSGACPPRRRGSPQTSPEGPGRRARARNPEARSREASRTPRAERRPHPSPERTPRHAPPIRSRATLTSPSETSASLTSRTDASSAASALPRQPSRIPWSCPSARAGRESETSLKLPLPLRPHPLTAAHQAELRVRLELRALHVEEAEVAVVHAERAETHRAAHELGDPDRRRRAATRPSGRAGLRPRSVAWVAAPPAERPDDARARSGWARNSASRLRVEAEPARQARRPARSPPALPSGDW